MAEVNFEEEELVDNTKLFSTNKSFVKYTLI